MQETVYIHIVTAKPDDQLPNNQRCYIIILLYWTIAGYMMGVDDHC